MKIFHLVYKFRAPRCSAPPEVVDSKSSSTTGFSLVELLVVLLVIGVIAAIAVPFLHSSVMTANEASAVSALRLISGVESSKFAANGSYRTLGELHAAQLIDERYGGGGATATEATTTGYHFRIVLLPATASSDANYLLTAYPVSSAPLTRTGMRRFGLDKQGVIYADRDVTTEPFQTIEEMRAAPVYTP